LALLRLAAKLGNRAFAAAFGALVAANKDLMKIAPAVLYRTLGQTLDGGRNAVAAPFWGISHQFAGKNLKYAHNAGFTGSAWQVGEQVFKKLLTSKSGFLFAQSNDYEDTWNRLGHKDRRIRLHLAELYDQISNLDKTPLQLPPEYPFVLSAGNRRANTANTIIRDASWDKKGDLASIYVSPVDAERLNISNGDQVRIKTKVGSATTFAEINEIQREGTIALPNGVGLDYVNEAGETVRIGISPNELTASNDKDFFAATPWHKFVPANLEKIAS
jgi:anaerobic selenocysteine-containing dehydrogenase